MNIVVCVKQVMDTGVFIELGDDGNVPLKAVPRSSIPMGVR